MKTKHVVETRNGSRQFFICLLIMSMACSWARKSESNDEAPSDSGCFLGLNNFCFHCRAGCKTRLGSDIQGNKAESARDGAASKGPAETVKLENRRLERGCATVAM
ncbi:hypothetical protein D5086_002811 [Populus alba]|uniref:Uncharacterized protein n=1 Tax=Populus alba TaxID=43335 RepID=A0ACC4D2K8_POPAL